MSDKKHPHIEKFLEELNLYKDRDIFNHYFDTRMVRTGRIYIVYKRNNGIFGQGGESYLDYMDSKSWSPGDVGFIWRLQFRSQGSTRSEYFHSLKDALTFFIVDSFMRSIPDASITDNRKKMKEDLVKKPEELLGPLRRFTKIKAIGSIQQYQAKMELIHSVVKNLYDQGFIDPSDVVSEINLVRIINRFLPGDQMNSMLIAKGKISIYMGRIVNDACGRFLYNSRLRAGRVISFGESINDIDIFLGKKEGIYTKLDKKKGVIRIEVGYSDFGSLVSALNNKINSLIRDGKFLLFCIPVPRHTQNTADFYFDALDSNPENFAMNYNHWGTKRSLEQIGDNYGFAPDQAVYFVNKIKEKSSDILSSFFLGKKSFSEAKLEYLNLVKPLNKIDLLRYY